MHYSYMAVQYLLVHLRIPSTKLLKHPSGTLSFLLPTSRGAQVRKAKAIHLSSSMPPPVDHSSHFNQRLLKCISHMSKDDDVPMQPEAALGANQWNSIPREGQCLGTSMSGNKIRTFTVDWQMYPAVYWRVYGWATLLPWVSVHQYEQVYGYT